MRMRNIERTLSSRISTMVMRPASTDEAGRSRLRVAVAHVGMTVLVAAALGGCTNVARMQRAYQEGDTGQLDKLIEIVSRKDYPYATRKSAATALGEIGNDRAVPVLISVLGEFDRRTTLKREAVVALGKIGDPIAVESIGRLMDRSLGEANSEMLEVAMPVLGQLGGSKAAEMLVNALEYYDALMVRAERSVRRGVFSGERQYRAASDSTRRRGIPVGDPSVGALGLGAQGTRRGESLFGTQLPPPPPRQDDTPKNRQLAHASLVQVGMLGVAVIERHLATKQTSVTLKNELLAVVEEIQAQEEAPDGS